MSKKTVIRTSTGLAAYLDGIIEESMKSALHQKGLQEKEKQVAMGGSQGGSDNSGGGGGGNSLDALDDSGDDGGDQGSSSKTMDDETEKLKDGDIEPRDITDKLNTIRSGKSFKDDQVSSKMEEYVNSLSKAEKTALLAFLKGIAQIVTGEIPAGQATEPDTNPADVQMQKGPEAAKTKHIQPNVIKAQRPKDRPKGNSEDSSGPVPITPKRR
jgi:hypothetical protein